jgi:hypothetical protein
MGENSLGFKTVTTMLSHIERRRAYNCDATKSAVMKALNSLANILVMKGEIVAVTLFNRQTDEGDGWHWLATPNPCYNGTDVSLIPAKDTPSIKDPRPPEDLGDISLKEYIESGP